MINQSSVRFLAVRLDFVLLVGPALGGLVLVKRWFLVAEARILSALCSCEVGNSSWKVVSDMRIAWVCLGIGLKCIC